MSNLKNILLNKKSCKSIWFMRQAGRYLSLEIIDQKIQLSNFLDSELVSK